MAVITIKSSTKKKGRINLRFRIRDGRKYELYYKSGIEADIDDLKAFDMYGIVTVRFGRYNRELKETIDKTVTNLEVSFQKMKDEHLSMTGETLNELMNSDVMDPYKGAMVDILMYHIKYKKRRGFITEGTDRHMRMHIRQIYRYLYIKRRTDIPVEEFTARDIENLYDFLTNEYLYVERFPHLYKGLLSEKKLPRKARSQNTVATIMKKLKGLFQELNDMGYFPTSPFVRLGKDALRSMMRQQYDPPVYLRDTEFQRIIVAKVPKHLQDCKDLFVLHCALGCRISDLTKICRDRICVNEDGIAYFRYVPEKTSYRIHDDIETPLMKFALDILKKHNFKFSLLNYVYGEHGYNTKIRDLLEYCGINRPCKVWDEGQRQNVLVPLYEFGTSKICRKTHEDMMVKVQIQMYTTGLHRVGSSAINAYTNMELIDRFRLMCLAFDQPEYKVDKNLEYIA